MKLSSMHTKRMPSRFRRWKPSCLISAQRMRLEGSRRQVSARITMDHQGCRKDEEFNACDDFSNNDLSWGKYAVLV